MPKFFNGNAHAIRVNGQRFRAGEVFELSGEAADVVSVYPKVESATSEQEEAWQAKLASEQHQPQGFDRDEHLAARATAHRQEADRLSISVPLNEVVGDDAAPHGPGSGTVTTKQAVIRDARASGSRDADHFGPGERLPEDADNPNLNAVERAQAEAKSRVEDAHNELLAQHREATADEGEEPKRGARKRGKRAESSQESGSDAS